MLLNDHVQRTIRRGCLVLIAAGLLLGISTAVWCRPVRVEREFSCIRLSEDDGSAEEPVTIRLEGNLRRRLFASREFTGQMELEGYPYTQGYVFRPPLRQVASEEEWLMFPFYYWEYPDGVPQCRLAGQLLTDPNVQRVVLLVQFESASVFYAIAGAAADREEAMRLYQDGRRAYNNQLLAVSPAR